MKLTSISSYRRSKLALLTMGIFYDQLRPPNSGAYVRIPKQRCCLSELCHVQCRL